MQTGNASAHPQMGMHNPTHATMRIHTLETHWWMRSKNAPYMTMSMRCSSKCKAISTCGAMAGRHMLCTMLQARKCWAAPWHCAVVTMRATGGVQEMKARP